MTKILIVNHLQSSVQVQLASFLAATPTAIAFAALVVTFYKF